MGKTVKKLISTLIAAAMIASAVPVIAADNDGAENDGAEILAGEETRRAEEEARLAEEETRRAEEEAARKEFEAEKKRTRELLGLPEYAPNKPFPTRPPIPAKTGEISLASEGSYSEVVYIEDAEDLLAIDGHDGGYYELKNDISIAGIEWKPLMLTNATFNGAGHTISGLTITSENGFPITVAPELEGSESFRSIGFLAGHLPYYDEKNSLNTYVMDLNLADININITKRQPGYIEVKGLGSVNDIYCDGCKVSGKIEVRSDVPYDREEDLGYIECFGLQSGNNCESDVDITVELYDCNAVGLLYCSNCVNRGDITVESFKGDAAGLDCCSNCVNRGEISAISKAETAKDGSIVYAEGCGISGSTGCSNYGNVTGNSYAYGISGGNNNYFEGNVTVSGMSGDGSYSGAGGIASSDDSVLIGDVYSEKGVVRGIGSGSGNTLTGNVYTEYGGVNAISYGENNTINGDVYSVHPGQYTVFGIYYGENNTINGDVYAENGEVYGIFRGENSTISGDVYAENGEVKGISGGGNNTIIGDIHSGNGRVYGISDSNNNIIQGNITVSNGTANGISGNGNTMIGNVTASNGSAGGINGDGNILIGNVTALNGDAGGIKGNGYISGTITESPPNSPTLTVSASSPYQGYYKCGYCGATRISPHYYNYSYIHCYSYSSYSGAYPHYFYRENDLKYNDDMDMGSEVPPEPDEPEPTIAPAPTPSLAPASYSVQVLDEASGAPLSGMTVIVDGNEYVTDDNGVVTLKGASRMGGLRIEAGGDVIYTQANFYPIPNQMNVIRVSPLSLDKDDFNFGSPGGDTVKGPQIEIKGKKYPAFELPGAIDVNLLDAVRMAYDPDEKSWRVILGGSEKDLQEVKDGDYTPAFAKKYREAKEFWEKLNNNQLNEKEFEKYNTPQKKNLGWGASVAISGFMELKLSDNGDMVLTNGGIVTAASVSMSGAYPLPPAPYVYLSYSLSGSLESELKLSLDSATIVDPALKVTSKISFDVSPSIGVGLLLAVETGLSGKIHTEVSLPFDTMKNSFEAELSADYYFMLKVLAFEMKYSHTFIKWQMYPPGELELMSIDESDFTPISRDYLNAPTLAAADADTLKQNIYTYSTVKSVLLGDGRELMVWLDDDPERSDANRTVLFYRILENGTWSETKQIENDGTADFDFDLRANGNEAVIVWQDTNAQLEDTASLEDMANSVEISYAKFDGENWSEPVSVTSGNSDYEYSPRINGSYIIWTQNNLNSTMPGVDDTTESIYRVRINASGEPENAEVIYDGIQLLYGSAVDKDGNVAYIADVDGDVTTPENRFYVSDKSYGGSTVLSGLQYTGSGFAFTEDGVLKTADAYGSQPITQCSPGGESIAYITDSRGNIGAAVYEVQDGFTSNLYASYHDNSKWTNPVKITDFDEKIRSWDAYLDEDGNIVLSAALAKINVDGDNLTDSVRLVHTKAEPIEDIETITVYPDGDVVRGRNARFVVDVANNTKSDIKTAQVTLKSGDTVLYEGEKDVNLIAGKTTSINISAPIPDNFTGGTITASVSVPDLADADTGNNSAQTTVGDAKLSVGLQGDQIFGNGYAQAVIENVSCEDVSNAILTVTGENGEAIYSETIDSIAAGETKRVKIELDEKYYTFADNYDSFAIKASVKYGENEETDTYRIKPQSVTRVSLDEKNIVLNPGESYKISANFYPVGTSADIYTLSSDESVVTADGGTVTAVGEGTATVTVMAAGAVMPAKLNVYVRDLAEPVITSAQYTDHSDEYSVRGNVEVTVDTSACLAKGETEKLIIAAYAEDGSLLGVKTNDVQASGNNNVYMSVRGKKPKYVKAMIWSSLSGMKPAALAARYDLPE